MGGRRGDRSNRPPLDPPLDAKSYLSFLNLSCTLHAAKVDM